MHIAILGWGSLIWDKREDFEEQHAAWDFDGPSLPLEFSRVSKTRQDALTLVIDEAHGSTVTVAHARSKRRVAEDAIADLRCREGTTLANIGYFFAGDRKRQSRSNDILSVIDKWASSKRIDVVVWTDLTSNFLKMSKGSHPFSVAAAIAHLQALPPAGKAQAAEYIWRAPDFIRTALRSALESEPWFQPRG